ncbi:ISL3 family transposase [uncultured Zhongshania sp.]|uniref:ISL3 family transposase n=1 Tax=uncultured Zhongshania sp. TaxID=1642288 RepID=UPI0030D7630B
MSRTDNVLNLPAYAVRNKHEDADEIHFHIEAEEPDSCHVCGVLDQLVRYGSKDQRYRDLPIHGKPVSLWVVRRRYQCRECGSTFRPELHMMKENRMMTERLYQFVSIRALYRTHSDVARDTGLDEKTVRQIFQEYTSTMDSIVTFETPRILGIDELYLNKRYRCIITNLEEKTMVDMLPNRNKPHVISYLHSLKDKEKVQIVSIDMWPPYRDAVKQVFPQATIVVDRFHAARMANEAMEKARKAVRGDLTPKQRRTLKGDRKLLLKHERDLSDRERLFVESWVNAFPELHECWKLKTAFYDIWESQCKAEAMANFDRWAESISGEQMKYWSDVIRSFRNWRDEIFNYFDLDVPVTNAFTESLNRLAKDKQRDSRGYSFEVMRAKMLYTKGHKKVEKKARKESPFGSDVFYKAMPQELGLVPLNYGVDLSTIVEMFEEGEL